MLTDCFYSTDCIYTVQNTTFVHDTFFSNLHKFRSHKVIRSQGHAEKTLSEFFRVRQNIKNVLIRSQVQNMRVLDSLGTLTGKTAVADQVSELRKVTARDNVHLTPAGYKALALGVYKEAALFSAPKVKVSKHDMDGATQDWHGFISHVGIGKAASRKVRSASHIAPRAHPYKGRGRGRR